MSILSLEFIFFLAIYIQILAASTSITSCQLSSHGILNTLSLKKGSFCLSFLKVFFFKCTCKNEIRPFLLLI